jgi:hypothetical protein
MAKKASDATPAPRRRTTSERGPAPDRAPTPRPAPPTPKASAGALPEPSFDEIAQAAYLRYVSRGGKDGQDFDDWVEAERELKGRRNGTER